MGTEPFGQAGRQTDRQAYSQTHRKKDRQRQSGGREESAG